MKNYYRIIILLIGGLFAFTSLSMTPSNSQTPPPLSSSSFNFEQKEMKFDAVRAKAMELFSNSGLNVELIEPEANGTLSFISGNLGKASQYRNKFSGQIKTTEAYSISSQVTPDVQSAIGWLNEFSCALGMKDAANEFIVKSYDIDELGKRHIRFQQVYYEIPVWTEELYIHIDENDNIYAISGCYEPTPSQLISLSPTITADQALENAKSYLKSINKWQPLSDSLKQHFPVFETPIEKVIWFDHEGNPHLVWFINMCASLLDPYYLFIDAKSGQVIYALNNRQEGYFVDASGIDYWNDTKYFRAYCDGIAGYYMLSDKNNGRVSNNYFLDGIKVCDWRNQLMFSTLEEYSSWIDSTIIYCSPYQHYWFDPVSVSMMVNLVEVYEYYRSTHHRNGIDNDYLQMAAYLNIQQFNPVTNMIEPLYNAYWISSPVKKMFFGFDYYTKTPLASCVDVVAHECTHGVTEHTAKLIYLGQSGALNDSFSDVFACMVDRNDWLFGEDLYKYYPLYVAARDLSNPRNSRLPISSIDGLPGQPAHMDEYKALPDSIDHGGVHYYCGIPNRAAYLIASQIGRPRTEQIYYRALCYYLLPQSDFEYAGVCLVQSAVDLYGINSIEQNAVISAFEDVGIFDNTNIIATFLREDFDDKQFPPSNWKLVPKNSNCTWYCGNLKTEYDFSQIDGNSKYSAMCKGDSTSHQNECLYTPQFSLKNEIPYLKFYAFFHFNWLVNATLKVWIKSSSLAQWKELWNAANLQDDGQGWAWRELQIDLSEYTGHSNIQLCWQYLGQKGGVIAIDKIRLKCTMYTDVRQNENISTLPILFQLDQNYPNPFNSSTTIEFALPKSAFVTLKVYNMLGEEVATPVVEQRSAGIHKLNWDAGGLASGVYLYRLEAGEFVAVKKLILMR